MVAGAYQVKENVLNVHTIIMKETIIIKCNFDFVHKGGSSSECVLHL